MSENNKLFASISWDNFLCSAVFILWLHEFLLLELSSSNTVCYWATGLDILCLENPCTHLLIFRVLCSDRCSSSIGIQANSSQENICSNHHSTASHSQLRHQTFGKPKQNTRACKGDTFQICPQKSDCQEIVLLFYRKCEGLQNVIEMRHLWSETS